MTTTTRKKGCHPSHPLLLANAMPMGFHLRNLTPPPAVFDGTNGCDSFQMFLNDTLGDCVKACDANYLLGVTYGATGKPIIVSDSEVRADYFTETGGADVGLDLGTDLAWEAANGLKDPTGKRHPCGPYGTVNPRDLDGFAKALYYFKWLKLGVSSASLMNASAGQLIDAPRRSGSIDHCVGLAGRRADGAFKLVTWGEVLWVTPAWISKCCGEAWARYRDQDLINPATGQTFDGFNLDGLQEAWAEFTGQPPIPNPPPPVPSQLVLGPVSLVAGPLSVSLKTGPFRQTSAGTLTIPQAGSYNITFTGVQ